MKEAFRKLEDFEAELKFDNLIGRSPAIAAAENELQLKEITIEFSHKSNNAISNECFCRIY
jgi:hypothetical protein